MKQYNIYKDSGVEWIGKIPEHWEVLKTKFVLSGLQDGTHGTFERVEKGYPLLSAKNIWEDGIHINDKESCIKERDYKSIVSNGYPQKEDVCLCCVGTIGRCCLYTLEHSIAFQRSVTFLRPNKTIISKFLLYEISSQLFKGQIDRLAKASAQSGIYLGDIAKTIFILPYLPEQRAIATYLDTKCSEIDSLVSLQEEMISELQAYKQSVITEAVTKGLDKNVKYKDSGVEWIGEIPEGWNLIRLRNLCSIQTGNLDTQDSNEEGIYPFYVRSPIVERCFKYTFEGEGILMAGDGAGAGRVFHHVFGKYAVHQRVYRLAQFSSVIDTYYLYYYVSELFKTLMDQGSAQSTVPSVRLPMLKNMVTAFPSLPEQQQIATYLDTKCAEIDSLIDIKKQKITELKEYKKSIIFEYVTGKKAVPTTIENN